MARKQNLAAHIEEPTQRRLPPLLRRAWYSLNQAFRRRITHLGITPDQYSILRWLTEGDLKGLTQREIADLMASDPNTITSILNRMEESGMITRREHEADRRAHRGRLKTRGRRALAEGHPIAYDLQKEVLTFLPASRLDAFLEELELVANACQKSLGEKDFTSRNK